MFNIHAILFDFKGIKKINRQSLQKLVEKHALTN